MRNFSNLLSHKCDIYQYIFDLINLFIFKKLSKTVHLHETVTYIESFDIKLINKYFNLKKL